MSQTPEIHLSSAALTFGWALLKPQPLPSKPSAGGTLRSLLWPHSGTPATLPRLSAVVQPCPWQGIHWKPIHGPSPSSLLRVPGAGQVTRELTQPVLLPHPCIPHHRPLPGACRASSLGQKLHFFFYKAASLQLKGCCFDTYRKLWKNELQEILSGTVMQILITPIKRKLRHSAKCLL